FINWSNNGNSTLIDNVNITTTVTGVPEENSMLSLNVFPNPSSDQIQIGCQLEKQGELKMKLVNSMGQVVEEVDHGIQQGYHVSRMDVKKYPAGIYNLLVSTGDDRMMVKKIVVLK
ncbi:MAG: T9SS type A sorting domain-containing protein, partial [Phycisphaeraceae bacterium]|nr:T9SS type A sorting domain-containing protein [Phycisphaeraceae bacterium]